MDRAEPRDASEEAPREESVEETDREWWVMDVWAEAMEEVVSHGLDLMSSEPPSNPALQAWCQKTSCCFQACSEALMWRE